MSMVFVVDTEKRPLAPCHPARARKLLTSGKAAVWRRYPFIIIFKRAVPDAVPEPLRVKIDPGSKVTGLAIVNDATGHVGQVVWAAELTHRGQRVHKSLLARRALRRGRRQRHTRYRPARFNNRRRREGWLPPSLESRLSNVLTWVARLCRYAPISGISQELVKFDTQLLEYPDISGVAYQQGELAGYEVREYLLEKWARTCAYCGATGVPLQVEHIVPKARGGSDRVSNLTIACEPCNTAKGTKTAAEFGHPNVQAQARRPLRDAAAINASRWVLYHRLQATGLSIEVGTGGRTKWNRITRCLPKTHWLDAVCVGASTPQHLHVAGVVPLQITATGRHSRQMCRTNAAGFPVKAPKATSVVGGMRTGDIVRAVVPFPSIKSGVYVGRLAVRATGSCNIKTRSGMMQGILVRYCQPLHRGDGYFYRYTDMKGEAALPARPYNAAASMPLR
ncbi:MAG TPA: RNA-guided endonuclease IscB [Ktedonobacterales bacterium]|nr:RNA-guided endonuclease IscB [Ktedonobacterales bacterium]